MTLQNRAQVLLAICGVLLSTSVILMTGKAIARPELPHLRLASRFMIAAGAFDIFAGAVAIGGVLVVRWVPPPADEVKAWLMARLTHRDRKTLALNAAIVLMLGSMILYQTAATLVLAGS